MTSAAATRPSVLVALETVVVAGAGGVLAGFAWSLVGLSAPAAMVGALAGGIAGFRGIYQWRSVAGWLAFVLDSTWAVITTAGSLVAHLAAGAQRQSGNYVAEMSERRNRHVYARGYTLRRGFMLTVGNTINGAGAEHQVARRRHTVDHHEHVHVWQSRWFGPIFPAVYTVWYVVGLAAGAVTWLVSRPPEPIGRVIDTCAYYRNPFEWWAYSREGRWPPPGAVGRFVWRRPIVRAFDDDVPTSSGTLSEASDISSVVDDD